MHVDSDDIAELFAKNGWTWSLAGRGNVIPDGQDIEKAFDECAKIMKDEDPDANPQMYVGRMIVRKMLHGYEVFVYAGDFY